MSNTTTNNNTVIRESINEDYEWIQYNKQLRIIHSIKDDMYQMQSIITACQSNKLPKDWFDNQSSRELLSQFQAENARGRIPLLEKSHEKRDKLANGLRGYYVHRLLVNAVAMWASPRYALDIFILLDKIATEERKELEGKIQEQKPRMVPEKKEKNYKYMIWLEEVPEDEEMINMHLVRRNNRTFSQISSIKNSDKCWFYRDNLPVAMTPNEDIKVLIKKTLPGSEYSIKGCSVIVYKKHLELLHNKISEYFDEFQN